MANILRCLVSFLFCASSSYAAEPGEIDLAGWIKNAEGTYTKAFNDSNGISRVTLNSPPTGLSTTSTALVNTSKGVQSFDITKTTDVDVSRIGKAMRGLAVLGGPVGMAITAASLVCELTTICNQAGQWMIAPESDPSAPNNYPVTDGNWSAWAGRYVATPEAGCRDQERLTINIGAGAQYHHMEQYDATTYKCYGTLPQYPGNVYYASTSTKAAGCAPGYTVSGSNCVKDGVVPVPVTASDWDAKESLLNDSRFVPELNEKGIALPTSGIPTLNPDQKKRLGVDSEPTKDSQGNVTGRQETVTEIEAVDAATSEAPGRVIIKETVTKIQYDNNNTQTGSSTSTSYSSQPQPSQPQPSNFEIKFDEVPPAELQTHVVPVAFSPDSWGAGTCPPDVEIAISLMTFSIPSQPVCSTAEMINPFVLTLASIMAIYIISGVRGGQT